MITKNRNVALLILDTIKASGVDGITVKQLQAVTNLGYTKCGVVVKVLSELGKINHRKTTFTGVRNSSRINIMTANASCEIDRKSKCYQVLKALDHLGRARVEEVADLLYMQKSDAEGRLFNMYELGILERKRMTGRAPFYYELKVNN